MSFRIRYRVSACLVAGALAFSAHAASKQTALDRYVAAPDPNYKWELVNTIPGEGYTTYVIDLTSQQYLTTAEVDHPIWKHWLTIVKPDTVKSDVRLSLYYRGPYRRQSAGQARLHVDVARDGHRIGCQHARRRAERARYVCRRNQDAQRRRHHRLYLGQISCGPATRSGRCACP